LRICLIMLGVCKGLYSGIARIIIYDMSGKGHIVYV
jgi:hypothetical protein